MHFFPRLCYTCSLTKTCAMRERNVMAVLVLVAAALVLVVVAEATELLVHCDHGNEHNHYGGG